MLILSLALSGAGLACWPGRRAELRLGAIGRSSAHRRAFEGVWSPGGPAVLAGVATACAMLGGLAGGAVGVLVGATVQRALRRRSAARARTAAVAGLAEALAELVAQLRAGAHPAIAAESIARDATPDAARAFTAIASAARLGGDVEAALTHAADRSSAAVRTPLGHLTLAWVLAQSHGLPLADVLEAVRRDLDADLRFTAQLHARMAGPRASAAVLAGLPLLALLLGEAIGAGPLRVLFSPDGGRILLLAGVTLMCAGTTWAAQLTRSGRPA